jgi:ferredoxin
MSVPTSTRCTFTASPTPSSSSIARPMPSMASIRPQFASNFQMAPEHRSCVRTAVASPDRAFAGYISSEDETFTLPNGMVDYYSLLGVDDAATPMEIKSAWKSLAKVCHPDISGDGGHNMCILLNEAYTVLYDPDQRREYNQALDEALADESDGYTGEPLSKWCANTKMGKNADAAENRAVFVDELTCIGCKQCVWCAPATFRIEDTYGRSRVFAQWVDTEDDMQAAMDACPVSCIHWVEREDLPALEFVSTFKVPRVNVGVMMAGQGGAVTDVWDATARYLKDREEKRKARERAAKYSKAQAAARANAAADLMRQQQGWFSTIADKLGINEAAAKMYASMDEAVYGSSMSSDDDSSEYAGYQRVGRRTRAKRPDGESYGARGANGGRVPDDRALVPASGSRRVWER